MVSHEDVDEELQTEIEEECNRYGKVGSDFPNTTTRGFDSLRFQVQNVIIYQERQSEEDDAEVLVKIFVEFKEAKAAKTAKGALNGRFFGGRIVVCEIYDQDLYDHNDFSG